MIDCNEAAKFIRLYLDQEISEAENALLQEHIAVCQHCRGKLEYDLALKALVQKKGFSEKLSDSFRESIKDLLDGADS